MTEHELILTSVLNCRRVDLYVDSRPLTKKEEKRLSHIAQRRKGGEPLQYILGHCEFMGLRFSVYENVLIPRPETELLVEAILERHQHKNALLEILDLGTGSGNIAVSLAKYLDCQVTTADVSKEALVVAKKNASLNFVSDKIRFIQSDLFSFFGNEPRKQSLFDIIVSNPPYIQSDAIHKLSKEVRREPRLALDGGKDGLDFYRRIALQASRFLKVGGHIFLEIGDGQKKSVEKIFENTKNFILKETIKDYRQTDRVLIMEHKNG